MAIKDVCQKWTGYEIFVDYNLGLWIVFDSYSKDHKHHGWYPFDCILATLQSRREKMVGFGKVWDYLPKLSSASFDDALDAAKKMQRIEITRIS